VAMLVIRLPPVPVGGGREWLVVTSVKPRVVGGDFSQTHVRVKLGMTVVCQTRRQSFIKIVYSVPAATK